MTITIPFLWQVKTGLKPCITCCCFLIILGRSIYHPHSSSRCSDAGHVPEFLMQDSYNSCLSNDPHTYLKPKVSPHTIQSVQSLVTLRHSWHLQISHSSNISKNSCRFSEVMRCWITRKQDPWPSSMLQYGNWGSLHISSSGKAVDPLLRYGQNQMGTNLSRLKNPLN